MSKIIKFFKTVLGISLSVGSIFFLYWLGWKGLLGIITGILTTVIVYEYAPVRFFTEAIGNFKIK